MIEDGLTGERMPDSCKCGVCGRAGTELRKCCVCGQNTCPFCVFFIEMETEKKPICSDCFDTVCGCDNECDGHCDECIEKANAEVEDDDELDDELDDDDHFCAICISSTPPWELSTCPSCGQRVCDGCCVKKVNLCTFCAQTLGN